jgi:hypothetical protein
MTVIADFDPDEQRLLLSSLDAAAIVISASSPGRKEETASEGFAVAELVLESEQAYVSNPLVLSTILVLRERARRDESFPDYVALASAPGARERAETILREVVALLRAKAEPEEAAGFKGWLMSIARAAAEAGKEDQGFLGRGGVLVNDAERAALLEVATLLGTDPPRNTPIDNVEDGR